MAIDPTLRQASLTQGIPELVSKSAVSTNPRSRPRGTGIQDNNRGIKSITGRDNTLLVDMKAAQELGKLLNVGNCNPKLNLVLETMTKEDQTCWGLAGGLGSVGYKLPDSLIPGCLTKTKVYLEVVFLGDLPQGHELPTLREKGPGVVSPLVRGISVSCETQGGLRNKGLLWHTLIIPQDRRGV